MRDVENDFNYYIHSYLRYWMIGFRYKDHCIGIVIIINESQEQCIRHPLTTAFVAPLRAWRYNYYTSIIPPLCLHYTSIIPPLYLHHTTMTEGNVVQYLEFSILGNDAMK